MKEAVATLKRLCRQRTVLAWKQWRESIELETKAPALQVSHAALLCRGLLSTARLLL